MPPEARVRAWLWDIQTAADAIDRFTRDLDGQAYERSDLVTAAVERKFEIIGEALTQMLKAAPETAERIPDVRQIIAFRNLLIHGYAVVQHDRVLRIVQDSLPLLKAKVTELLREMEAS
jgi:uncharacterized protein with HEPN domain